MKYLYLKNSAKSVLAALLLSGTLFAQDYTVQSIPAEMYTTTLPFAATDDDSYSGIISLPFDFDFFGNNYNQLLVCTNGYIDFRTELAGQPAGWAFVQQIPHVNFPKKNVIMPCMSDLNASDDSQMQASITYAVTGLAPFRKFVLTFTEQPTFGCGNDAESTFQAVLYETSNYIDVQVVKRQPCLMWNSGNAVIGIIDETGTIAYTPPNRNTGNWSVTTPEGWRFKPEELFAYTFMKCANDGEGVTAFDLAMVQGELDPSASFYNTLEDAEGGVNAITSLTYTNTVPYGQSIIYVAYGSEVARVRLTAIDCENSYDGDTVPSGLEDVNEDGNLLNDDTDFDGLADFLDNDDDGDQVLTSEEYAFAPAPPDNDNDDPVAIDTDNDGIPNYLDNDDDNDGILTIEEYEGFDGNNDQDNDAIVNYLDNDDDNDGMLTQDEYGDTDNDSLPDYLDNDDDGDGILTADEDLNGNGDFYDDNNDDDGEPNYRDSDDDNDGILTLNESGDTDNDSVLNYLDVDDDGDNIFTLDESGDTDNDTVPNYLDIDDDGDNILTLNESGDTDNDTVPNYLDNDDDGDGLLTLNETGDTNNDTVPNYLDKDDDGDGVLTLNESGDTDNDTVLNHLDTDDDGDSILTINEDVNNNGDFSDDDTDDNGTSNYLDKDDDGDGILTIDEDYNGNGDPMDDDSNNNTIPDYLEDTSTAGTGDHAYQNSIRLYPNPASDLLNIDNKTGKEISNISIYAVNGVLVKQSASAGNLSVSDLQSGVYIVKIAIDDQVLNYRFIKQ